MRSRLWPPLKALSVRIRLPAFRVAAWVATVAAIALLSARPQAVAEVAGLRVSQAYPAAEPVLAGLRSGSDGLAASDEGQDAAADAPVLRPRLDGVLVEPAAEPAIQDGLLRGGQSPAATDGDLSADGKLAEPAGDAAETSPAPNPAPSHTRLLEGQTDARTAAGRSRPVAEDDNSAVVPAPVAPASDTPSEEAGANDAPPAPSALLPPPVIADAGDDPYRAVGYRLGGFLLSPSITAESRYSDNVRLSSTGRQADAALVLRPGVTVQSLWSRHSLELDLRGATTTYAQLRSEDAKDLHAGLRGRFDLSSLASLEAEIGYDFNTLARSDPSVAATAARLPTAQTESLGLAYNQRFDRLSLRFHGTTAETAEGDSGSGGQDYRDDGLDLRAGYEVSPGVTVFGAGRAFDRNYSGASGIDARGEELRLGVETDRSAKLSGMASLGAASIAATDALDPARAARWPRPASPGCHRR